MNIRHLIFGVLSLVLFTGASIALAQDASSTPANQSSMNEGNPLTTSIPKPEHAKNASLVVTALVAASIAGFYFLEKSNR